MTDRRISWRDLALTAALVAIALMGTGPAAANQGWLQAPGPFAYGLAVLACLPVLFRRRRPGTAYALTGLVTMVYMGLSYPHGPILFAFAVVGYAFAAYSPVRRVAYGVAALLVLAAAAAYLRDGTVDLVILSAWLVVPAALGVAVKVRRDATVDVREEQARRAVSEERLQLAQEVHDVVGHGLAVIAMQAGVALKVLDRDPTGARAAVEAIRATSREALDGLRAEVEALRGAPARADEPAREPSAAPLRPGVGLADVPRLAERIRSGGLSVAVELDGVPGGLPAEVDRAAYRIVQESLTNVLRHAGPAATARVRAVQAGSGLLVEVLDDGRGVPGAPGHGIEGMRDRARALGGTLEAGPRRGGGFAVRAYLPLPAGVSTPGRTA